MIHQCDGAKPGADAPNRKGAGGCNTTDNQKQFATLRAQLAMQGHTLHRTSPDDGPVAYYAERWGLVRYLPTLDDVNRFLMQIGGAQ